MAVNIRMPSPSPSPGPATLARWFRTEGDRVMTGDVLAEIEVEAPADGILARVLVRDGTPDVETDRIIGILVSPGEDISDTGGADTAAVNAVTGEKAAKILFPEKRDTPPEPSVLGAESHRRIFVSPVARRLARSRGLDLSQIVGSGPGGRILRRDVESAALPAALPKVPEHSDENEVRRIPLSAMRLSIGQRLTVAKRTVPHFYVSVQIDVDGLLNLRKDINEAISEEESTDVCHPSVSDMLIRAAALTLKAIPEMNVCWGEESILLYRQSDIAVAVSVSDELLTPVIRDAGGKSLTAISHESRVLIASARDGKLRSEETKGGCFTLFNADMFGVESMAAIINPPHAAILAVGAITRRPVVRQNQVAIASVMTCTLSADHRVIDGALAAQWLDTFRKIIEQPIRIMI
ncbi:pyruvate dehydrogenase complex dihydrolipoamide acetyltransferase [Acetobacter musti]|uniref:Dihydrolipoamide acetyltransferase component of pyruvate dehydrogenase complex n=1 Tax=Acetobacter musti TaxID=864732 RepID=A0ABX0JTN9_9PROT|nr:2-oxo acid dehydrogenase subunit E2 [Acetobacter musti]NHN86609.1 pyruvate dehydrogenase complex dihydrolipoamide acetyltransferase [Acetobacter musti]